MRALAVKEFRKRFQRDCAIAVANLRATKSLHGEDVTADRSTRARVTVFTVEGAVNGAFTYKGLRTQN